jgi:hypothetical protein
VVAIRRILAECQASTGATTSASGRGATGEPLDVGRELVEPALADRAAERGDQRRGHRGQSGRDHARADRVGADDQDARRAGERVGQRVQQDLGGAPEAVARADLRALTR